MSNLHRIHWIDGQIRAGRYPNARTASERFEISQRQAARDIEYLRYSMGAPLAYSAEKNGYFYEDDAFALPAVFINADDKQTLSYLALQYRNLGSESASRLADLLNKLSGEDAVAESPREHIPALSVEGNISGVYIQLHNSISRLSKVRMRYCNQKVEISERIFCPYKLFAREGVDYVVGYCELRQEVRVFRIDRIRRLDAMDDSFRIIPEFNPDDFDQSILFRLRHPYTALIRFRSQFNLPKLRLNTEEVEPGVVKISFYHSSEILAELVRLPAEFSILSPQWLKERLKQRFVKLIESNPTT